MLVISIYVYVKERNNVLVMYGLNKNVSKFQHGMSPR